MLTIAAPTGDTPKDALRAIGDLISLVEPRLLELWTTTGITFAQRRLLRLLDEAPRSAGALAAELGVAAPSLTRQLQKLEDQGLITRAIDRDDRRRVVVALTPAGAAVLGGQSASSASPLAHAVRELNAKQRRDLTRSLSLVIRMAREKEAAGSHE
jgi:DNA-binding MarR family transcriptional regulator